MSYYDNVYYSPEKFGLEIIGSLCDPDACWSFDDLIVWKHEDGRLFYATDSGCSCPSPFEDFKGIDDLTEITDDAESWTDFQEAVESHCAPYEYNYGTGVKTPKPDPQAADKTQLLALVAGLLRGGNS